MKTKTGNGSAGWTLIVMAILAAEKIIQHIAVTTALSFNWQDIRTTVAVNPDVLAIAGAGVAILFIVALWGLLRRAQWATGLLIGLAVFDMIGEFIAQGRLAIQLNVSFLVATVLLVVGVIRLRGAQAS
jgi:hypothetical protein